MDVKARVGLAIVTAVTALWLVARGHRAGHAADHGGLAGRGGRQPALHTDPYLDNPHARTNDAHPGADNAGAYAALHSA
jgi:hypothetical protein